MTGITLTVQIPDNDNAFRIYSASEALTQEQLNDLIDILADSRMLVSAVFEILGEVWVYRATNAEWADTQRAVKCFLIAICGWSEWDFEMSEIPRQRSLVPRPSSRGPNGHRTLTYVPAL